MEYDFSSTPEMDPIHFQFYGKHTMDETLSSKVAELLFQVEQLNKNIKALGDSHSQLRMEFDEFKSILTNQSKSKS